MTPTKLLIGQILIVFAIVIAGLWAATQWAASMLGHQPQLGLPWFRLGELPVYRPWAIFPWCYHYEAYAPDVFDRAGTLAGASGFVACAAAIFGSLWRARQSRHVTTYGSARWATAREVVAAGLFRDAGVFLGQYQGRYLRHEGPEHVMAFAPTRSGKGVGLVVPTLLSWTGSAVIHDIKGENWTLTAGWRARFSHCLLFNPTDPRSARYNPLLEVRRGAHEVRDVQNIADILVDPEGALERRSHWEKTSHSLLVGTILHILYAEEEKTLARVAGFLSDPKRSFVATLRRMMATNHLGTLEAPLVHPVVASAARELLNKSENERSGVLSTAMSFLGLYRDPTVTAVTSACDWRIADLVEAGRPVSLYLVIPPSDISRTKPLVRLVELLGRPAQEPRPIGDYVPARRVGDLLFLSATPAKRGATISFPGVVGRNLSAAAALESAHWATLTLLEYLFFELRGDLSKVRQFVRLTGYVASEDGFHGQADVMNGASRVLVSVFGPRIGLPTRTSIGVRHMPRNASVAVSGILEVDSSAA